MVEQSLHLGAGFGLGGRDRRGYHEEQLDVVWVTAAGGRPGPDIVAVLLHPLDPGADGNDRIRRAGSELTAFRRGPGLQEGRTVLR